MRLWSLAEGAIYAQMLQNKRWCVRIYKTQIHMEPEGDTHFWPDEGIAPAWFYRSFARVSGGWTQR